MICPALSDAAIGLVNTNGGDLKPQRMMDDGMMDDGFTRSTDAMHDGRVTNQASSISLVLVPIPWMEAGSAVKLSSFIYTVLTLSPLPTRVVL